MQNNRSDTVKCAVIQMNSSDDWRENLLSAQAFIKEASDNKARLIVLPENFLCFGASALSSFAPHVSECINALQSLSDVLDVTLVCGSVPVVANDSKYFARCYVLRPSVSASYYDKIHLFDVDVQDGVGAYRESDTYLAGSTPVVCDAEGQMLGLSICYDLRFPELCQKYLQQGASLISVPSAFTYTTGKSHWEILLRARAIETQCYILAANQCGEHGGGRQTWGHSMIVAPTGEVLSSCDDAPDICYALAETSKLENVRSAMPLKAHKRLI